MRILVAVLCAGFALAGEPDITKETKPITMNLDNVDYETAARMLKDRGQRVRFAPQAAERRANVRLVNVPLGTAMTSIADHFGCEVRFLGRKRWHIAPAWQFDILDKLESDKTTPARFDKVPIGKLLELVRAETGVDLALDPEVDPALAVTLRVSKIPYRKLLDQVAKQTRLAWELRYGVVYVATAARLGKLPVLAPGLPTLALRDKRTPVDFDHVALGTLVPTLTKLVGVPFVVPEELRTREVTARARDITVRQALALLLYPAGMTAVEKDGAVHVQALPGA